jgi:hypothetical protein
MLQHFSEMLKKINIFPASFHRRCSASSQRRPPGRKRWQSGPPRGVRRPTARGEAAAARRPARGARHARRGWLCRARRRRHCRRRGAPHVPRPAAHELDRGARRQARPAVDRRRGGAPRGGARRPRDGGAARVPGGGPWGRECVLGLEVESDGYNWSHES